MQKMVNLNFTKDLKEIKLNSKFYKKFGHSSRDCYFNKNTNNKRTKSYEIFNENKNKKFFNKNIKFKKYKLEEK